MPRRLQLNKSNSKSADLLPELDQHLRDRVHPLDPDELPELVPLAVDGLHVELRKRVKYVAIRDPTHARASHAAQHVRLPARARPDGAALGAVAAARAHLALIAAR